jgi:mannose-6-phosphate isomerase
MPLYPLKFEPIYKAKVWGGRTLERLNRRLPAGESIGESWELADLGRTSASGGGGGAARSVITNGSLARQTIHDAMNRHGGDLMGHLPPNDFGEFPLLVKFLDAAENLSVQVHPSQQFALENTDAYLKSEAWYIVDAEPGAVIYKGVKAGTTAEQFRAAIENNTVEDLIIPVPVKPGDVHYLPSGTCHALGKGVLVAEVQTPSDTTFRVYDWGRTGRELHVDQALECIEYAPADTSKYEPHTVNEREQTRVEALVRCEHFHIDRIEMAAGYAQELTDIDPVVWMVLEGKGEIACGAEASTTFAKGQTLLLPARMSDPKLTVVSDVTLLEVKFPQASADLIA